MNNTKLSNIMATWFGSGVSSHAPGTFGSSATIPLAIILAYFTGIYGLLIAAVVLFFVGVWATKEVTKDKENKDIAEIVIDETVGQLITFSLVSNYLYNNMHYWWLYLVGFLLFRFFDIVKFGPVKYFDKQNTAWGVMMDDVCAGVMAAATLYGITYFIY